MENDGLLVWTNKAEVPGGCKRPPQHLKSTAHPVNTQNPACMSDKSPSEYEMDSLMDTL